MSFDDLIEYSQAPESRSAKVVNGIEHKMHEGAVMVALALNFLKYESAIEIFVHPDGEHGKRFDFVSWLNRRGGAENYRL